MSRRSVVTVTAAILLAAASNASADRVRLRSGKTVNGLLMGADPKSVRLLLDNGSVADFPVEDIAGVDFTARQGPPLGGSRETDCNGTQIFQLSGVSNLSGRFAPDDQTLAATESNVYPLNTGETVTYTWDWQAHRR